MIPSWLLTKIREGHRGAWLEACPHCGQPVLAGLDRDVCALMVRVDPTPVFDPSLEGQAILAQRRSYDLVREPKRAVLYVRDPWNMGKNYPCFLDHQCDNPVPMPAGHHGSPKKSAGTGRPPY